MNSLIQFEEHALALLVIDGRPAMLARQVGIALGYQDEGKSFAQQVTEQWGEELENGRDFKMATYAELSAWNVKGGNLPPLSTRGALVLFESGIYLACLLSKKDAGRRLRRKLADEVFPQLARDGRFDPERRVSPETGAIEEAPTPTQDRIERAVAMARHLPEDRRVAMIERLIGVLVPEVASAPGAKPPLARKAIGKLGSTPSPEEALVKIVTWARTNRSQLWSQVLARTSRSWLGRWDEGDDLFVTRPALLAALGGADLHALELAWTRTGALVPEEVGRYTMRVRVDGVRLRCYRFSAARLPQV